MPTVIVHTCRSTTASEWHGGVKDPNGQQHGIKFIGSDGWIWVTRGVIEASDRALIKEKLPASALRVYVSNDHMGNFVECVKSRKDTICPAADWSPLGEPLPPGCHRHPLGPPAQLGSRAGAVRRRRGSRSVHLPADAPAVRLQPDRLTIVHQPESGIGSRPVLPDRLDAYPAG